MSNDYEETNEELAEAKADLSAENNARQLNARMVIGRKSEIARAKGLAEDGGEELSGVDDGVPDEDPEGGLSDSYLVSDETIKASLAKLPKAEELVKPKTYKLKVNGKEVELSEEEMIARVQKVEAADQYLAEAKRAAEAAKSMQVAPSAPVAAEQPSDTLTDEDLRRVVRNLQVGSEEEAAAELKRYLTRNVQAPSVNMDELAAKAVDTIRFQEDAKWFEENYKDIFQDEHLRKLAIAKDDELRLAGDKRRYRDRYAEIGEELRKWIGTNPAFSEKARKKQETLTNIPAANLKARLPVEDDDSEPEPRDVIAEMARARGQRNLGV